MSNKIIKKRKPENKPWLENEFEKHSANELHQKLTVTVILWLHLSFKVSIQINSPDWSSQKFSHG